ncbi:ABC transporter permease [Pseudoclavibacter endophyticus]|uniref:ABC transporter permease n=1 Tax=Pseudoclavibacter endophyticus TaxID=1778590 RepID=A0A6H9WNF0_9MICO|nr:ABC transporter permease [Pseudoclavibacter endophyticus]KAB1646775.1 ABC transporter permease [Pseudoclavibacter endophyticus]GGA75655.1 ABC transporter permease [Pseudoclavibacter endophyticus]
MLRYTLSRLAALLQVLVIMSIVIYGLIYAMPGDPATVILGDEATPERVAELRGELGLDQHPVAGYVSWAWSALGGDLGDSIFLRQPVTEVLGERMLPTLSIAVLATFLSVIVAIPLATFAARRRGGVADVSVTVLAMLGIAVPGFVLALFLVRVFAVQLGWFPPAGFTDPGRDLGDFLRSIFLPAASLAVVQVALLGRITRSSVVETLGQSFVTVARAKGLSPRGVLFGHALRASLVPILTVLAGSFGTLLAGAAVVETVFNIQGVGELIVTAISRRDYPVIQGTVLTIALIYVVLNFVVDLLYPALDPRIRLTAGGRR